MAYPKVDFRVGCTCPACELAVLLWYTEDEHPMRAEWQKFWDRLLAPTDLVDMRAWPCSWQIRQYRASNAPTAYKI